MNEQYEQLKAYVFDGEDEAAAEWAQGQLAAGVAPMELIRDYLTPVLGEVGEQFSRLEIFLPDVVLAAEVAEAVKNVVNASLSAEQAREYKGRVVLGTMQGDVHDIGKNIVATLLGVNGYEVTDLGNDVAPIRFLEEAERLQADIIGLSSLLTTSMPYMQDVLKLLNGAGVRDKYRVICGGGPVSAEWTASIGGDGYSEDANEAVTLCDRLMAEREAV